MTFAAGMSPAGNALALWANAQQEHRPSSARTGKHNRSMLNCRAEAPSSISGVLMRTSAATWCGRHPRSCGQRRRVAAAATPPFATAANGAVRSGARDRRPMPRRSPRRSRPNRQSDSVSPDLGEQAGADPAGMAVAAQRHHRHAHPQRLAGGGGAVVGKRIERNVDPIVEREMRAASAARP